MCRARANRQVQANTLRRRRERRGKYGPKAMVREELGKCLVEAVENPQDLTLLEEPEDEVIIEILDAEFLPDQLKCA